MDNLVLPHTILPVPPRRDRHHFYQSGEILVFGTITRYLVLDHTNCYTDCLLSQVLPSKLILPEHNRYPTEDKPPVPKEIRDRWKHST